MTDGRFARTLVFIALCGAALALLYKIWPVVVPFALGLTMAYVLSPIVDRLTSLGLRRDRVVIVLYLLVVFGTVALVFGLLPVLMREANAALTDLPTYTKAINQVVDRLNLETRELVARLAGVRVRNSVIPLQSEQLVAQAISGIPSNFLNVLHVGLWAFVIPFVGFFALAQGRAWIDTIFDWTPSEHVETMLGFIAELNARLGGYIRGVILESVCVGVITIIGLWLLGIDGAVLIGVITGIVNVVPFMAPVIGGTLAIAAGYFQGKAVAVLLSVLLLYILVRLFDDMVLVPFVVGSQVQLHPVAILLAVLTGIELAGVLGLLFAVPITVILKVVLGVFLRSQREGPSLKHHDILS